MSIGDFASTENRSWRHRRFPLLIWPETAFALESTVNERVACWQKLTGSQFAGHKPTRD